MGKYYSLEKIEKENSQYNMIIGERSNGKTYSCLYKGLKDYLSFGGELAIVRRWGDDFKGKRGSSMFNALVENGVVNALSRSQWTDVYYYGSRWYLCYYDDKNKRICDNKPFAYAFALTSLEHDKSTSYPNIVNIVFDEFLSRGMYLPDEFVTFCNTISTIIRHDKTRFGRMIKIYMLGNTVNQYCPYFAEMGIQEVKSMDQGTIKTYHYGDSELKVSVEYCNESNRQRKDSDDYFAFNNPKLEMITGGAWEIDIYPHCPIKYKPKDIMFTYFIKFVDDLLQCEIVYVDNNFFTFIHRKTTDIQDDDSDIVFSTEWNPKPNHRRNIMKPLDNIGKTIKQHYVDDRIFYQDNQIGEIVRNYLLWCKSESTR